MSSSAKKTFERALAAHHSGAYQEAKALCEEAIHLAPDYADPLHLLGMIAGQEKNISLAIDYLSRAATLAPHSSVIHNHLANLYAKQKNIDTAEKEYRKAIELQPDYTDAHYNLGLLALKQGHFDEALSHFQNVARYAPHHFAALQKCGDILMQQEKIEEAIACYEKALALEPYSEEVLNNLGAAELKRDRPMEAIKYFSTALRVDENNIIARSNLAGTLIQQHRYRDAAWHYQRLLDQTPDNLEAHYNVGVALMRLEELNDAIPHFQTVLAHDPDHHDARNNLGITFLKLGQKEEAIRVFEESLRLKPDNPAVQYLHDALTGKITPEQAPPDYVKELFDTYADYYEAHVTDALHYVVPQRLRALIEQTPAYRNTVGTMLDLGCGTGLSGQAFHDIATRITGIDLSSRMIDMAQSKKIYDELVVSEMLIFLKERPDQYDFILAADVLVYVGDLEAVFSACYAALHAKGLFAFSTEISAQETYVLQPSARYAHAQTYIDAIATRMGFKRLAFEQTTLRTQKNVAVPGFLYVFGK